MPYTRGLTVHPYPFPYLPFCTSPWSGTAIWFNSRSTVTSHLGNSNTSSDPCFSKANSSGSESRSIVGALWNGWSHSVISVSLDSSGSENSAKNKTYTHRYFGTLEWWYFLSWEHILKYDLQKMAMISFRPLCNTEMNYINGFAQDCGISSAIPMELPLSCAKVSISLLHNWWG